MQGAVTSVVRRMIVRQKCGDYSLAREKNPRHARRLARPRIHSAAKDVRKTEAESLALAQSIPGSRTRRVPPGEPEECDLVAVCLRLPGSYSRYLSQERTKKPGNRAADRRKTDPSDQSCRSTRPRRADHQTHQLM